MAPADDRRQHHERRLRRSAGWAAALLLAACHARLETAPAARPDIILVTIESLRADVLVDAWIRAPVLARLGRQARSYEEARAQALEPMPAAASILTGLLPSHHRVRGAEMAERLRGATLAEELRPSGYATGAVLGSSRLAAGSGLERGFESFDDHLLPRGDACDAVRPRERAAGDVVSRGLRWWSRTTGRPRFLWLHFADPAWPHGGDAAAEAERYAAEVESVDRALGELESILSEGSTVLAIVATSGEALGEHGEFGQGWLGHDSTVRIPLWLWAPGRIERRRDDRPARQIDVAPSLLELAGLRPPSTVDGQSLLRRRQSHPPSPFESWRATRELAAPPLTGVVDGGRKLLLGSTTALFDLLTDPEESRNLAEERAEVVAEMALLVPPSSSRTTALDANPADLAGRLRQAETALCEARFVEAASVVDEVLRAAPQSPSAHRLGIAAELGGRRYRSAIDRIDAWAAWGGADELALWRARAWLGQHRPRAAIRILEPRAESGDVVALTLLAEGLAAAQAPRRAVDALGQALQREPWRADLLVARAELLRRLGQLPAARLDLERAVQEDPRYRSWAPPASGAGT